MRRAEVFREAVLEECSPAARFLDSSLRCASSESLWPWGSLGMGSSPGSQALGEAGFPLSLPLTRRGAGRDPLAGFQSFQANQKLRWEATLFSAAPFSGPSTARPVNAIQVEPVSSSISRGRAPPPGSSLEGQGHGVYAPVVDEGGLRVDLQEYQHLVAANRVVDCGLRP